MHKLPKILIINPNSDTETCKKLEKTVKNFCNGLCQADVVRLKTAPVLVASYEDRIVAVDELMQVIRKGETHYDAFVLACHADPNLDLAREITSKPVVGIAEASMKLAASLGSGFAVISPSLTTQTRKYALAHKYHLDEFIKGVVVPKSGSVNDLYLAAKKASKIPCVGAIVLGCANYTGADKYIEKRLNIPVIDGVVCAIFLAIGLSHYQRYKNEKKEG
jgi:allantoin racemase